uniref:Uncharacterized protein n=1 Tax=Arundo donax TaxID=35708 RepID=A0A0A9GXH3_ARUDO
MASRSLSAVACCEDGGRVRVRKKGYGKLVIRHGEFCMVRRPSMPGSSWIICYGSSPFSLTCFSLPCPRI